MNHACDYCTGKRPRGLVAIIRHLRIFPNKSSSAAARDLKLSRTTVWKTRKEAETRGCVPPRTADGRSWEELPTPGMATVFPIGTVWTAKETKRAA
jgi:hypothetical protein